MVANVGGVDRAFRIIIGLIFLILGIFVFKSALSVIFIILGALALLTGIIRFCPGYLPFKFSSVPVKKAN